MRLFLALHLDAPARDHLQQVQAALRPIAPELAYTKPDNLHLTLKFLGDVRDAAVPELIDSLNKVERSRPLTLHAAGVMSFPDRGPIRVVTAALTGDDRLLAGLNRQIEDVCATRGFERERRKFRPHITLARGRPVFPANRRQSLTDTAAPLFPGPDFTVPDFHLVRSFLKPTGSEYQTIATFPLGESEA